MPEERFRAGRGGPGGRGRRHAYHFRLSGLGIITVQEQAQRYLRGRRTSNEHGSPRAEGSLSLKLPLGLEGGGERTAYICLPGCGTILFQTGQVCRASPGASSVQFGSEGGFWSVCPAATSLGVIHREPSLSHVGSAPWQRRLSSVTQREPAGPRTAQQMWASQTERVKVIAQVEAAWRGE